MIVDTRLSPQALAIEGWAALPSNDIQCIWVTVDGVVRALAETGLSTPKDGEGRALTRWSDQAGWRATLERESIDAGTHRIGALVLRGYGLVEVLEPHEMEFPTTGKPGAIDEPATGAVVAANLAVRGWFLSGRGYDCVEVSIDGAKPSPGLISSQSSATRMRRLQAGKRASRWNHSSMRTSLSSWMLWVHADVSG
jgi:hypothetical protein